MGRRCQGGLIFLVSALVTLTAVRGQEHETSTAGHTAAGEEGRWNSWFRWDEPRGKSLALPMGDLFTPLLADPKQPRFSTSLERWDADFGYVTIGTVTVGESFGILRWPGKTAGNGWQWGVSGMVAAIFTVGSSARDLINADYYLGLPVSYRRGRFSARFLPYHQSSHLGDEFILNAVPPNVPRLNLSFEALDVLASWETGAFRFYGGGSYIPRTSTPLGRLRAQLGSEYHSLRRDNNSRWVAGLDLQAWEETDWNLDVSLKGGWSIGPRHRPRSVQLLLEYYNGRIPHGQFFEFQVKYLGVALVFSTL